VQKLIVPFSILFLGGVIAGVWFAVSKTGNSPPEVIDPSKPTQAVRVYQPPSDTGYVGSAACGECHGDLVESYKSHPMSRSIERVTAQTAAHLPPGGRARVGDRHKWYEVEFADGRMRHSQQMADSQGTEVYSQVVPMQFVVGSGREAKAYLHQRGDLLFMSPLNWYAKADQWDFAPGYDVDDPRRFDRRVTDQCLACHAGRVAALGRSLNRYEEPVFHEMAIGCENCHGPGAEHISFHQTEQLAETADPIVNPRHLSADHRDSVCYQCHLHGEARILRSGRSEFDFRPGMLYSDVWTMLVSEGESAEKSGPHAVSQVQQTEASRCYQESQGKLGCISCHDPHQSPKEPERLEFYRNRCLTCHQETGCDLPLRDRAAVKDSCIACHMPAKTTSNIAHVAQTDHRVLRRPSSEPNEASSPIQKEERLAFFDEAHLRLEPWEQDRALALGASIYLAKTGRSLPEEMASALDDVLKVVPDDGPALTALGALALDHNRLELARGYYEKAKTLPDAEENATMGLLKVFYLSRDWEQALKCADTLVKVDAGDYRVHAMRADVLVQLGRLEDGIAAAEEALKFHPALVEVREFLSSLYAKAGRAEEANEQRRIVRRLKAAKP
jgi:predicted CXXCH cytochrome family protein